MENTKKDFISFKELINKSSEIFKDKIKSYLGLMGISLVGVTVYGMMLVFLVVFFLGTSLAQLDFKNWNQILTNIDFNKLGTLGLVLALVTLVLMLFFVLVGIVSLSIIKDREKLGLMKLIEKSFPLIVPVMLTNFLMGILVWGGLWCFVIPGVIMAILMNYVMMEVVFEKKKGMEAIKSSIMIVGQNFGDIFLKGLYMWLIMMGISAILNMGTNSNDEGIAGISGLISMVVNIVISFFSLIYSVLVYDEARKRTDFKKKSNFAWVYITSIIGWIMAILLISLAVNLVRENWNEKNINNLTKEIENKLDQELNTEFKLDDNYELEGEVDREIDENYKKYLNLETMSLDEAIELAQAEESACLQVGELINLSQAFYNENSQTWWIDIESNQCNPACVVSADGSMEVNWRCTGLAE